MAEPIADHGKQAMGSFGIVFLLLFGLFWSGMTLAADGLVAWGIFRQLRAVNYSTAQGQITRSEIEVDPGGGDDGPSYHANLRYRYVVADRAYEANRYRYGLRLSTSGAAQQQVAEHPLGSQVAVYYRPNDPSDAILRVGIGGADLLAAMFMVPFNVVMLVIWRGAGGSLGERPSLRRVGLRSGTTAFASA